MAITHTNNWKNILNALKGKIGVEFSPIARVIIGGADGKADRQYIELQPVGTDMVEFSKSFEIREFEIDIFYHLTHKNIDKNRFDSILKFVSRFEALKYLDSTGASDQEFTILEKLQVVEVSK